MTARGLDVRARPEPPGYDVAETVGVFAAALALLLVRPLFVGNPWAVVVFASIYLAVGAAALAQSVPASGDRPLPPAAVLAVGVTAVLVASRIGGPRFPVPMGAGTVTLNALAAVSEEVFFRRFLFGRLVAYGAALAVGGSALLFALVHVPAYGVAAFWVDLGAGLLLSWQRWASGGWATPAITHVAANLLAVMG
jgi:membrane protease YdiL (CAAX protease family)